MKIYFDNSATTKPHPEVIQVMSDVLERFYGNPSSLHELGSEAEKLINKSKEIISTLLHIQTDEIVFTSGGTESNNLAIKGVAFQYQHRGKHLITTQIEHPAVYEVCQVLAREFGFEVTILPVDPSGIVSVEDVKKALREDTILVSIMHVNNEIGSVQPIKEIGKLLETYPKVLFHVDQVQGIGKEIIDIKESRIDLLSLSGHKIHAPKGTGMLYVRQGLKLHPLFHGGSQQNGLRPGTENVAGIVAFAKALRMLKEKEREHIAHYASLKGTLIDGLKDLNHILINTSEDSKLSAPHIVNVTFKGLKPEVVVHALEEKGIFVSTKSACSSKIQKPSRVLKALGLSDADASSAIRISFSTYNTLKEVQFFIQVIKEIIPYYQKLMKV